MCIVEKKAIFNHQGDDSVSVRTIIKGSSTGLFNFNQVKYHWAKPLYNILIGNFWVPEKVGGLDDDAKMYLSLNINEKQAYKGIISFLTFLDSIQTVNIPNISNYITAPEVNLLLSIQSFQEAIHTQSYATLIEAVIVPQDRKQVYEYWREDPVLLERNQYIGHIYQDFSDCESDENLFKVLIANFLLEGLYFYNAFSFFDCLAYHQKMLATSRMINYIRRDEMTHLVIFANIIKEIKNEFPQLYDEALIYTMFSRGVEQEIKWSHHIIGDDIDGISESSITAYTKWLANKRLAMLKLKPLYSEDIVNPYKHLEGLADMNGDKTNFFESTVTNYTQAISMNGDWDF